MQQSVGGEGAEDVSASISALKVRFASSMLTDLVRLTQELKMAMEHMGLLLSEADLPR